MEASDTRFTN